MQTATFQLLLPVCLAYCVLGAPSTQLSVYQDKLTISPAVLNSIEDIIGRPSSLKPGQCLPGTLS